MKLTRFLPYLIVGLALSTATARAESPQTMTAQPAQDSRTLQQQLKAQEQQLKSLRAQVKAQQKLKAQQRQIEQLQQQLKVQQPAVKQLAVQQPKPPQQPDEALQRKLGVVQLDDDSSKPKKSKQLTTADLQAKKELDESNELSDWYWGFGLAYSAIGYSGSMKTSMAQAQQIPGMKHIPGDLDIHVYWPLSDNVTLLGIAGNFVYDAYMGNVSVGLISTSVTFSVYSFLFGPSVEHFFSERAGQGFFLRGDVGVVDMAANIETDFGSATSTNSYGAGGNVMAGYAIPLTSGTRMTFFGAYSPRYVKDAGGLVNAGMAGLGLMF